MMKKLLCSLLLIITTIGFIQAQSINVTGLGNVIAGDGSNIPVITDDTDFGSVDITSGLVTHTFTVTNTTGSNLVLLGFNPISGANPTDFILGKLGNPFLTPGASTTFPVSFDPDLPTGLKSAIISLDVNNLTTGNETYNFNIQGTGTSVFGPEIDILGNGVSIVTPDFTPSTVDDTDFGQVDVTSGSVTHTFTITNTGNAPLVLTGAPLVLISGGGGDFTVSNFPTTPIPVLTSTTFDITFNPNSAGIISANVLIQNDDSDESNFLFAIQGEGTLATPEIDVTGNGVSIVTPDFTPSVIDDTDFGQVNVPSGSITHTFTITNTGSAPLNLTGASLVLISGGGGDFTVSNLPTTPIPALASTTFDITFDPSSLGIISANVLIQNDDTDESNFLFTVQGEGTIPLPEMDVFGNSIEIVDGDITPDVADDTDFGQTDITSGVVVHTFTIQNNGAADLNLTDPSPFVTITGANPADFTLTVVPASPIAAAGNTTFEITFDPSAIGIRTATVSIANDDSDENPYTFNVQGEGIVGEPEMDVFGNGVEIIDGDVTPDVADDTDFGQVDVSSGNISHTFTIENNGIIDLNLTDPSPFVSIGGANAGDFTITTLPSVSIVASGSTTFAITFNPSALGIRLATVSIANDDTDENPYTFDIQGEGIDVNLGSPLLITQYYEGIGVNDKWIEVKNITSGLTTLPGAYHLSLFEDLNGTVVGGITTNPPNVSVLIPGLSPGEVVLFRRSGATLVNTAAVSIIDTEVCRFDGDDIILISTSNGTNSYNDRIDIVGVVGNQTAVTWGIDTSLIKGCGTTEAPTLIYDATEYIDLEGLSEVDNASTNTNLQLGTQTVGPTIWTSSWDNNIPDRTKNAIINGTYANSDGSFDSCNLTVNASATINLDSGGAGSNYILVQENLTVNGIFIIGDTEALVTVEPTAIMSGSIQKNESTTPLNNFRDFTYWSSPVNTTIGQAFVNVGADRIFQWEIPTTTPNFWGDWSIASGTMTSARGYISEAPSTTPDGGTHSVTFAGTPNNGTLGIFVGHNNDAIGDSDFNLIGNPYPSAINIDQFIQLGDNGEIRDNTNLDGTIWLWTHNTGIDVSGQFLGLDYATYNLTGGILAQSGGVVPTGNIGSGQGFFVKTISSGTVFFQNDMRLQNQNDQFFRAPDTKTTTTTIKDRVWLNVESNSGGAFSQILVGFFGNATDGFDRGYEGTRLGASWIDFYSKIDTVHYAVQGLSSFNLDKKVAIGFDTYIPDALTYTISIYNTEGALNENDIYLVDNELGIVHDLKLADYEFDVNGEGNFPDRFTLQFTNSVLDIDDLEFNTDFVVINEDNSLQLRANTVIKQVKVYDMMGRLLIDTKPNESEFSINTNAIRKGTVLIINATFENGAEVSKKAIKY